MTAKDSPTCRTCPYWSDPLCKKNAPTLEYGPGYAFASWPGTAGDDWCGEHPDFTAWQKETKR